MQALQLLKISKANIRNSHIEKVQSLKLMKRREARDAMIGNIWS
jgi:hypothetical protein